MSTKKTGSSPSNKPTSAASGSSSEKPGKPSVKKKKYKNSRAGRCEQACDEIRDAVQKIRDAAEQVELRVDMLEEGDTVTLPDGLFKDLPSVEDLVSPIEELREELQGWYDNLPESLQSNRSDIEEAAQNLESAKDTMEGKDMPDLPEDGEELDLDKLTALKDDLNEVADNLESGAEEAESTDFPGMYG
jgi:hypothetical protein